MNDIIAKLYDKAIVIEDGGDYVCGELDPEKFAELIIRECIDLALGSSHREDDMGAIVANKIKEHFGVSDAT